MDQSPGDEDPSPAFLKDLQAIADGQVAFSAQFYSKITQDRGNLFFSPLSIHAAMTMINAGARENTSGQLRKGLHLEVGQDKAGPAYKHIITELLSQGKQVDYQLYEISLANALWIQKGYSTEKEYSRILNDSFKATINQADFIKDREAERKAINAWVENQTAGKFKETISAGGLSGDSRLVLTNAIYFKSSWLDKFPEKETMKGQFHLATGKDVQADLMNQVGKFYYFKEDDFQALSLSFSGREMRMTIFLPRKEDGLAALEKMISANGVPRAPDSIEPRNVEVTLPRFKIKKRIDATNVLQALGITDAFSPKTANLSAISKTPPPLFLQSVVHEAFISVDEEGAEAAGTTAIDVVGGAEEDDPTKPVIFRADHPFLFVIWRRGMILFMGRLMNPVE